MDLSKITHATHIPVQVPMQGPPPPPPPESREGEVASQYGESLLVLGDQAPASQPEVKRPKAPAPPFVHQPGKTMLPLARVQRIMKADKQLPACAKEAVFLISVAVEEFIKRVTESAHAQAVRDRRATVLQKDLAVVVKRNDELLFLNEIIYPNATATSKPRVSKPVTTLKDNPTIADAFKRAIEAEKAKKGDDGGEKPSQDMDTL